MDFDWKPLAGTLIKAGAPIIGGALLGPLGAGAGNILGSIVASALGVEPDPESVGNAIANGDPSAVNAALQRADTEATAKWDAIARIAQSQAEVDKANTEQINETMRAESAAGVSWWHWRHLGGYVVLWLALVISAGLIKAMFWGVPSAADLAALVGAITPIFVALCALNGYVAQDSNKLRGIAITGEQPGSVVSSIVKAVKKK